MKNTFMFHSVPLFYTDLIMITSLFFLNNWIFMSITFLKTSQIICSTLCVMALSNVTPAQACVSANDAGPMIKEYKLKTFSKLRGQIPGQILSVRLCGSGKSAKYHVIYKQSGKGGNKRATKVISAR